MSKEISELNTKINDYKKEIKELKEEIKGLKDREYILIQEKTHYHNLSGDWKRVATNLSKYLESLGQNE